MNDKQTQKENIKKEVERKLELLRIHQTLLETGFIIECKGRPNESFPIRWKLFKRYVSTTLPEITII